MEIGMSTVLILWTTKHLTLIVGFHLTWCSQNRRTSHQVQIDIALQSDTATQIGSGRQQHLSAATSDTSLDGTVDSRAVERLTITLGAIVAYIIYTLCHSGQRD